MSHPNPVVSVCVPTYNGGPYVERTIRSVLAQSYTDFELIVSDDNSVDGTLEIIKGIDDPRIRVEPGGPGVGAVANFNRALSFARGRYVKLMCQDDVLYPDCLLRQVEAMVDGAGDGVVLVSCRRDIVDSRDRIVVRNRGWRRASGVIDGPVAVRANVRAGTNLIGEPSAALCSAHVLDAIGGFSTSVEYMVDLATWIHMLDHGKLAYIPEPLCTFRVSSTSWSSHLARAQARQARSMLRSARRHHPEVISRLDLSVGLVKPTALAIARRGVFSMSHVLPDRGSSSAHVVERPRS